MYKSDKKNKKKKKMKRRVISSSSEEEIAGAHFLEHDSPRSMDESPTADDLAFVDAEF